jgi:putative hydrolase of the HAD superfamily
LNAPPAGPAGAVLLDALGTLVELEPPAPALQGQLRHRGIEVGSGLAERAITAEIAHYRAHLDEGRDAASLDRLRHGCAQVVADELARGMVAPPEPDEMTEILLASLQFTRFADVQPALRRLRRHGLPLVVVSNWDVSLSAVLERLGVTPLLDGIVTSAEAGVRKPAPEIFERALAIAGVGAGAAWHVGDSIQEDVAGARAAGIRPVLISRSHPAPAEGVPVISSLAELPGLLSPPAD